MSESLSSNHLRTAFPILNTPSSLSHTLASSEMLITLRIPTVTEFGVFGAAVKMVLWLFINPAQFFFSMSIQLLVLWSGVLSTFSSSPS